MSTFHSQVKLLEATLFSDKSISCCDADTFHGGCAWTRGTALANLPKSAEHTFGSNRIQARLAQELARCSLLRRLPSHLWAPWFSIGPSFLSLSLEKPMFTRVKRRNWCCSDTVETRKFSSTPLWLKRIKEQQKLRAYVMLSLHTSSSFLCFPSGIAGSQRAFPGMSGLGAPVAVGLVEPWLIYLVPSNVRRKRYKECVGYP